jgi:hypothetical protein
MGRDKGFTGCFKAVISGKNSEACLSKSFGQTACAAKQINGGQACWHGFPPGE